MDSNDNTVLKAGAPHSSTLAPYAGDPYQRARGNDLTMVGKPFKNLRNLTLINTPDTSTSLDEDIFHRVCALPSLVRLQIRGIYFENWSQVRLSLKPLEYLGMDDWQHNINRESRKKLEPLKSLKHLRLHLTGCQLRMENEDRPRYIENLHFLEHSLETLESFTNEPYCMPDKTTPELPKISPMSSLRSFRHLKTLTLTDMSLVGIGLARPEHPYIDPTDFFEHLRRMLPSSPEVLTHLVWDGPIINDDEYTLPLLRSRWSVIWSDATPDMFPNLKLVMVQEYGLNGLDEEHKVIWKRGE